MQIEDLKGKKIAIVGFGINNQQLAAYLSKHDVVFTVIDAWDTHDELIPILKKYDVLFRTPGLPLLSQAIQEAKKAGVLIYSQTKLFFDLCPAKIIGVTGTKGKGTTATLIHNILHAHGKTSYLGGNIGTDPFEFLEKLQDDDMVVLELSSFQLQDLHKSPQVAVVQKIYPEHMDHHQDFDEYIEAKTHIVQHQTEKDAVVLQYDNEVTRSFADLTPARLFWASRTNRVNPGCYIENDTIIYQSGNMLHEVMKTDEVGLVGDFNLENITAAIAASFAAGADNLKKIKDTASNFKGLPHRLELIENVKGVRFYNDSFSTTPETTVAALSAFEEPVILIVGGSDKKSDYSQLAKEIAERKVKALIPIGLTGPKIASLARKADFQGRIIDGENLKYMEEIVKTAHEMASRGDVVLLSPASASFDMFDNYKQRGELFKKAVKKLR